MTRSADPPPDAPSPARRSPLVGTLPLIVLTAGLFVASYLVFQWDPRLGPYNFPLYGLLLTLGFIAAIGAVVSWFFATDGSVPARAPMEDGDEKGTDAARSRRDDFGRPVPEVTRRSSGEQPASGVGRAVAAGGHSTDPWNEDVLPPVVPHGPRPVLTTPDDPGDIARALEEIADIQRELATRRPGTVPPTDRSTRA